MLDKYARISARDRKRPTGSPNYLDTALSELGEAVEKALAAHPPRPTCLTCSQPIVFRRGSTFIGWTHANGAFSCGTSFPGCVAEPTPDRLKIGRIRIKGVR